MEQQLLIEHFLRFGLTRQEAIIYQCLLAGGKITGYEVSKITGISRSNAYGALAALVEKGGAYVSEETAKKYIGVPVTEFCDNHIRNLEIDKKWMLDNLPKEKEEEEGYITVEGGGHIINKMKTLISNAEDRVYVSCSTKNLMELEEELIRIIKNSKKVVILTDNEYKLHNAKIYIGENKGSQIGIITDSTYVLTGEYGEGSMNTCLYSGQKNFVKLFKNALSNEIKLIGYTKGDLKK